MSRTISPSAGKPYSVDAVCRVWSVGKSTCHRRRREAAEAVLTPRRRGSKPNHSDEGGVVQQPENVSPIRTSDVPGNPGASLTKFSVWWHLKALTKKAFENWMAVNPSRSRWIGRVRRVAW